MESDFQEFCDEFKRCQVEFGLMGYKIYFKHERLTGAYASIHVDISAMTATVRLNNKITKTDRPFVNIKEIAQHEALHLLTGKLVELGKCRYLDDMEIYIEAEELVHKLESIIKRSK